VYAEVFTEFAPQLVAWIPIINFVVLEILTCERQPYKRTAE
jgi:hypothetical protein